MSYVPQGGVALDYSPCRYGASKLVFRGPRRDLEGDYVAVLGGSETYGRFVERPYPALVEAQTGLRMVNLGYVNAGPDVFLNDAAVRDVCAGATAAVIQVMGAQNLTNRFYAVHPRRNDRFLRASPALKALFREVDFTEFHFTRHLLATLRARSPESFAEVIHEVRAAWVARMRQLIGLTQGKRVLLWIGDHPPAEAGEDDPMGPDPLFVTQAMVDALRPMVAAVVIVAERPEARIGGTEGMAQAPAELPAATGSSRPEVHGEAAARLAAELVRLLR